MYGTNSQTNDVSMHLRPSSLQRRKGYSLNPVTWSSGFSNWNAVHIFTYGLGEVLAVVLALYCCRNIVAVAPVDIFGATSGASIDCGDDNIEYACAQLFGFFALCEEHPYVQKCTECKYA